MLNFFNRNSGASGKQRFPRTYGTSDFGITADVVVTAGQWVQVGTVTVPAQQEVTFGANDPTGGASVAGRVAYARFDNSAGTQLHGTIRLALTDANQVNTIIVLEESTRKFSGSATDRTLGLLLPEYPKRAKQDSKLLILFYSATSVTIMYNATNTLVQMPVTVYQ